MKLAREIKTQSGVPILADIPLLGFLFSNRTDLVDVALQNLINRTPEMKSLLAEYAEKVKTEGIPENVFPGTSGNKDRVTAANMAIRLKELQLKGLPVTSVFCPY